MIYKILTKQDNKGIFRIDGIIEQETGEILSIGQFLRLEGIVFVSDLNTAFFEIIKELKKLKYSNVFEIEKSNQFSFLYRSGECSSIKIKHDKKMLIIINFEKKFLRDFGDFETNKKLVEYSFNQSRTAYTIGRDSFNEWLKSRFTCKGQSIGIETCKRLFREDYPVIDDSLVLRAKESTSGYQMAIPGYYNNVYNYDIVSSFPAQLLNDTPIGSPIDYENLESMPDSYFYIVKATALDIRLKPNKIDFLNVDGKNIFTFVLTKHLFLLFKSNYAYNSLKIKQIKGFKTRKGSFTSFIQKTVLDGKIKEIDTTIAKYNKGIANAVVGYLGKNTQITQTKLVKNQLVERVKEIEPVYLPIYLYVTGKAKAEFISTLQRVGLDKIVYANTDGFLSSEPIDIDILNRGRDGLGAYKHKSQFAEIYIECVNGYTGITTEGEIDNTLSGMRIGQSISVQEYMTKDFEYLVNEITPAGIIERVVHR